MSTSTSLSFQRAVRITIAGGALAVAGGALAISIAAAASPGPTAPPRQDAQIVYIPDGIQAPAWVDGRREAQLETRDRFDVFHDFTFRDTQPTSGMSFLHRIVDDAGKY
jgi:hypothetical protein